MDRKRERFDEVSSFLGRCIGIACASNESVRWLEAAWPHDGSACGGDRPRAGLGPGPDDRARGQAAGPSTQQRRHRRAGQFHPLNAALVAVDWIEFNHDDRATLVPSLVPGHSRTVPLLWLSVWKDEFRNRRNACGDACLRRLSKLMPPGCHVTIPADRGFGGWNLSAFLVNLGFGYLIRFRGAIHVTAAHVTAANGQGKLAAEWIMLYDLVPALPEHRLAPLMPAFSRRPWPWRNEGMSETQANQLLQGWPSGGAGTAMADNGNGRRVHVMTAAGLPPTPSLGPAPQGVDGGPSPTMMFNGRCLPRRFLWHARNGLV